MFYVNNANNADNPAASFSCHLAGATDGQAAAVSNTLALNVWRFVAMTYTPSDGGPRLWVGSLSSAVAETSYFVGGAGSRQDVVTYGSDAADTAYIGNRGAADRTFDGAIEDPSVWDNAFTAVQLDALRLRPYAASHRFATTGGTIINLKGSWPLTESAAATCLDHSGNGNNGTVTGTTVAASAPYGWTRRGPQATIWTPAAAGVTAQGAHGAMYPRMQRHIHQSWTVPRIG